MLMLFEQNTTKQVPAPLMWLLMTRAEVPSQGRYSSAGSDVDLAPLPIFVSWLQEGSCCRRLDTKLSVANHKRPWGWGELKREGSAFRHGEDDLPKVQREPQNEDEHFNQQLVDWDFRDIITISSIIRDAQRRKYVTIGSCMEENASFVSGGQRSEWEEWLETIEGKLATAMVSTIASLNAQPWGRCREPLGRSGATRCLTKRHRVGESLTVNSFCCYHIWKRRRKISDFLPQTCEASVSPQRFPTGSLAPFAPL